MEEEDEAEKYKSEFGASPPEDLWKTTREERSGEHRHVACCDDQELRTVH